MGQKVKQKLSNVYSLVICSVLCLLVSVQAIYWYSQARHWQTLRRQGEAYAAQLEKSHDHATWLAAWQSGATDTLARVHAAAALYDIQVRSYESGVDLSYTVELCGTFPNIILFLHELERPMPPVFCRSISIGRGEMDEALIFKIIV